MHKYYYRFMLFLLLSDIFLVAVLFVTIKVGIKDDNWFNVFLSLICIVGFSVLEFFLWRYNKSLVISVRFENNNCIIKTNDKEYIRPCKNFLIVEEDIGRAKTFITYQDNEETKRFVFQMKYSPFKIYYLDIEEMKKHLINAKFLCVQGRGGGT